MPVIYKKLQHHSQFGYNAADTNFINGGVNYGINDAKVTIFRFSHLEIPNGSTINSATLHVAYSAKDNGTTYSFTQAVYIDGQTPTQWLDTSRKEWSPTSGNVPHRTWSYFGSNQGVSFVQNNTTTPRVIVSHNVKAHMDAQIVNPAWTLAGGSVTFLLAYGPVSSPNNIYVHTPGDSWGPMLVVDYTPPASDGKSTAVNLQENSIFNRSTNAAAAFDVSPHGFNDWLGAYIAPSSVSVTASTGTEVTQLPPSGGNMLRLQAGSGRFMYHFGVPNLEEGKWYNYSCYTWMPTISPVNFRTQITLLGDSVGTGMQYAKGVWVRHNKSFMVEEIAGGTFACVEVGGETWDSTAVLYVAGVQLTEGKPLRPWIGGNKTLTGADYGWAGITGTNGFVRAAPPTISVNSQTDKPMRKYYGVNWTYANTAGHVQDSVTVKVRKVR